MQGSVKSFFAEKRTNITKFALFTYFTQFYVCQLNTFPCDYVTSSKVLFKSENRRHFPDHFSGHVADVPAGCSDQFSGFEDFDQFAVDVRRNLTEDFGDHGLPRRFRTV